MRRLLANLIATAGVVMGWASLFQAPIYGPPTSWMIMVAVVFTCVLIHELGHLVAGVLTGGKVQSILVVPFNLSFRPLGVSLIARSASGDIGGRVVVKEWSEGRSRIRIALFAAGGPAANILASGFMLTFAIQRTGGPSLLSGLAGAAGAVSLSMAIANLVPHMRQAHASDGMLLLRLVRHRGTSFVAPFPITPTSPPPLEPPLALP